MCYTKFKKKKTYHIEKCAFALVVIFGARALTASKIKKLV